MLDISAFQGDAEIFKRDLPLSRFISFKNNALSYAIYFVFSDVLSQHQFQDCENFSFRDGFFITCTEYLVDKSEFPFPRIEYSLLVLLDRPEAGYYVDELSEAQPTIR